MNTIRIIGLGIGGMEDLTVKAFNAFKDSVPIYLRTDKHPIIKEFKKSKIKYESLDYLFENSEDFDSVYNNITTKLIEESEKFKIINYCVPGSPYIGDEVTSILRKKYSDVINIQIIDGENFIGKCIKMCEGANYNKINIIDPVNMDEFSIDVNALNIIAQVENKKLASEIKINLLEVYPDDFEILEINVLKNFCKKSVLFSMDSGCEYDFSTYFCIFPIDICKKKLYNVNNLCRVVRFLRGPQGCPWDRKQTPESCKSNIIEEANEVVKAIETDDIDNLCEELGDLLLQVIFQSEMASEEGFFNINDVYNVVCEKLIRRHPHVFGNDVANTPEEALEMWKRSKELEKQGRLD